MNVTLLHEGCYTPKDKLVYLWKSMGRIGVRGIHVTYPGCKQYNYKNETVL